MPIGTPPAEVRSGNASVRWDMTGNAGAARAEEPRRREEPERPPDIGPDRHDDPPGTEVPSEYPDSQQPGYEAPGREPPGYDV